MKVKDYVPYEDTANRIEGGKQWNGSDWSL